MAPTEVLAEQHATSVRLMLSGLLVPAGNLFGERPLSVELLTNRVTGNERKRILGGLASGSVDLVIGTHALIKRASSSTASAWSSSTSSTGSASSSERPCATRQEPRFPTCSS